MTSVEPSEGTSTTSDADRMAATESAVNILAQGKRNMVCGEIPTAVNQFQEACKILAKSYGETAKECADAYFCYGQALLDLARMENGVLGNALQGVPDTDEDENSDQKSDQFEKVEMEAEEREKLRQEVYDAMSEKEKAEAAKKSRETVEVAMDTESSTEAKPAEKSEEGAVKEKDKEQEQVKGDDGKEKQKPGEKNKEAEEKTDVEKENMEVGETKTKETSTEEAKVEKTETKSEKSKPKESETKAEKSEESETKVKKSEESEIKAEKSEESETKAEKSETKVDKDKEKPDKKEEKSDQTEAKADDKKTGDTKDVKSEKSSEEGEKEGEEKDGEEKDGEESMEDEEGEGTEEEGEDTADDVSQDESQDGENPDDVSNLQLAWEMLELAKLIYSKDDSKEAKLRTAESHLKLGEVSMETEQYEEAIKDFNICLEIQKQHLESDNRLLAETYYQLGLAFCFAKKFTESVESYQAAIKCIESRISKLDDILAKATPEEKESKDFDSPVYKANKEVDDLRELLPDIKSKIDDCEDERKNMDELKNLAKEALGGLAAATSASTKPEGETSQEEVKTTDISHLIKRKRKSEDTEEDNSKKARQEDGAGDAPPVTNGHAEKETKEAMETKS